MAVIDDTVITLPAWWRDDIKSTDDAVSWADRYFDNPDIRNATEILSHDQIQQSCLSLTDPRTLYDLAMTITVELSKAPNPAGPTYRYIYGINRQIKPLAKYLAAHTWKNPGGGCAAKAKTLQTAYDIAILVLGDCRFTAQRNKGISITRMAKEIDIPRQQFYEQWYESVCEMREIIYGFVMQARNDVGARLVGIGILEE